MHWQALVHDTSMPPRLRGARYTRRTNRVHGAASIARSKSAIPTRWQSVASAITTRTTFLDTRSKGRPENVALARTDFRRKSANSSRANHRHASALSVNRRCYQSSKIPLARCSLFLNDVRPQKQTCAQLARAAGPYTHV